MKFSCLISCYYKDSPLQLKESLDSLVLQTNLPTEVVFVADGELTSELYSVLDSYKVKLNIKLLQLKENKGLGNALHQGLKLCNYDIVIRMDTDDICMPDRFEKQIDFFRENPDVDILGSWAYDIDDNNNITGERKMPTSHKEIYKLIWTCPIIHPTVAFKKQAIINIGSYSTTIKRRQDYDLWFRAASDGLRFANIPRFLLKYRFTENFYKKNNFKVAYQQSQMGIKGLLKLKNTSPIAYLGVLTPLIRTIFPKFIAIRIHKLFKKIDPRKRTNG